MADDALPFTFKHPAPAEAARDWKKFNLTATTTAKRIEENGFPHRVVQEAWVRSDDNNTESVMIGPDQNADFHTLSAGETLPIPAKGGAFTLGNWWVKTANGTATLKVSFQ